MSIKWICAAAWGAVIIAGPVAAFAFSGEELAPRARVGIVEARAIALKAVPGDITDEELETEEGGSGLRYTFNIRRGGVTYEVGIDAKTGAVIENSIEDSGTSRR